MHKVSLASSKEFTQVFQDIVSALRSLHQLRGVAIAIFSLALPDPLRTGAYRLEIISAVLRGSGTVHSTKNIQANSFCWVLIRSRVLSCAR